MVKTLAQILEEQKVYYQARSREYDEWFYRQGRYDYGLAHTRQWEMEAEEVRLALMAANMSGQVVDIAAGTGIWTQELLKTATHVTALDSSPEMFELNRQRVQSSKVSYILTDLFYWQPVMAYDAAFMGFWLSHVPPAKLYDFLGTMADALKPGGKIFFVDSLPEPSAAAKDAVENSSQTVEASPLLENDYATIIRRLNDGREFQIVKAYYVPDDLASQFKACNIQVTVRKTAHFFLYGWGAKA